MTIHLCRDYLTQNTTTGNRVFIPTYLSSIFLRRVLGYTYVGDTNFPINAVGNLLIATGDTTPTANAPTYPGGNTASILMNGGAVEVAIPPTVKGVQAGDVGRIMCLKSSLYPTRNSGLFTISGLSQGNTTTIAAGSNGDSLPGTGNIIHVASVTGFPSSGTLYIGAITITTTAVAMTGTYTLTVSSTLGFPTGGGTLLVLSNAGVQTVTYTATTATTFTGCTGGTGSTFNGSTVTTTNGIQTVTYSGTTTTPDPQFTGTSGGTGTMITGEPVSNKNNYVIDYRGNGDVAMTENPGLLGWYLYDKDINCPTQGANNGGSGYRGSGTSTTPRIILQSPHVLGWQVRLCNETATDTLTNFNVDQITWAPGYGGNSAGDFPTGGKHLHGAMYYDTSSATFNTCTGMGDNAGAGPQYRVTMIGDDTGQFFHAMHRRPLNAVNPESCLIAFGGFSDNEPLPLPVDNTDRLFALGNGAANNLGTGRMNQGSLSVGKYVTSNAIQGASFHLAPISCSPSLWTYVTGVTQQSGPTYDGSAGDSPFTSATELMSVDLVVGVVQTWHDVTNSVTLPYYPRAIGNLPQIKSGRTNFGDYTLTTDATSWAVSNATNASPIQITTSTTNNLVTGQTVAINGVAGNTAANGTFTVTVINNTNFTLDGSSGSGTYTSSTGTVYRGASYQHLRFGTYIPWNGPAVVP